MQTWLAFGFLLVCVVNTVGLLLAKFMRRSGEIGVRRALGASRGAIFAQSLIEAGSVGLAGGTLGLALASLGLWAVRQQSTSYAELAHLDPLMLLTTFVLALVASLFAGVLPAWHACQVTPAIQLKASRHPTGPAERGPRRTPWKFAPSCPPCARTRPPPR